MRTVNAAVPKSPIQPGCPIQVSVGFVSEAFVNVTVVGAGAGYLSVNDDTGNTSVVNYDTVDRVESNSVPVRCPNGMISLSTHGAAADVIVDVFQVVP